jgi:hypothetical protein
MVHACPPMNWWAICIHPGGIRRMAYPSAGMLRIGRPVPQGMLENSLRIHSRA